MKPGLLAVLALALSQSLGALSAQATDMICHGSFLEPQAPPTAEQPASTPQMERLLTVVVISAETPKPRFDIVIESIAHGPQDSSVSTLTKETPIDSGTPGYHSDLSLDGFTQAPKRHISVAQPGSPPEFEATLDLNTIKSCKTDHSSGFCRQAFIIRNLPELSKTDTSSIFETDCAVL